MAKCFECGEAATHRHHVIPKSLGGIKTIGLCLACHSRIHGRKLCSSDLIRAGQAKARAMGKTWGGSKKGRMLFVTPKQVFLIRKLYRDGQPVTAIARITGVSRPTIYRWLSQ